MKRILGWALALMLVSGSLASPAKPGPRGPRSTARRPVFAELRARPALAARQLEYDLKGAQLIDGQNGIATRLSADTRGPSLTDRERKALEQRARQLDSKLTHWLVSSFPL
jgi:hypothetical protein